MPDPLVEDWLHAYQNGYSTEDGTTPVFLEPCPTCVEYATESFSPPHKPVTGGHRRHCTCERCW